MAKSSEDLVSGASLVKGFEFEKGRFVEVSADDLKSVAPKTSTAMEIQEFVHLTEVDPVYFETSYYVTPEEAGEKAYGLLYQAMQTTGLVAVAQFAMHNREHAVVLRPGKKGVLAHTLFYSSEVRGDEEYRADTKLPSGKELELAETLIRSLAAPFNPQKYKDTYREKLEAIIASKIEGRPSQQPEATRKPGAVVDIADALRKSLANLKKPAASDPQPRTIDQPSRAPAKKTSRSSGRK
jgi:DNA end-binding protein Ku